MNISSAYGKAQHKAADIRCPVCEHTFFTHSRIYSAPVPVWAFTDTHFEGYATMLRACDVFIRNKGCGCCYYIDCTVEEW